MKNVKGKMKETNTTVPKKIEAKVITPKKIKQLLGKSCLSKTIKILRLKRLAL